MPTLNHSSSVDVIVPSNNKFTYRGLAGDDIYIISKAVNSDAKITIVDTEGSNKIQLVDGLVIASSKFAANAVLLTLSNGATITINGASKFTFEISGNATTGTVGLNKSFAEFASIMGVGSLPSSGTKSGSDNLTVSGSSIVQEGLPKFTWEVSVEGQPDYNVIDVSATGDKTVSGTNDDDDFRYEVTKTGISSEGPYSIIIDNFDKDNDKITFIITDGSSSLTTQEFDSLTGVEVTSDGLSGTQIFFAPDSSNQSGYLNLSGVEESFDDTWTVNTYSVEITPLADLFVDTISYHPITEGEFVTVTITSDKKVLKDTIIEVYNGNSDDWSLSEPYNSEKQEDGSYASTVQVIMKAGTQEVSFQVLAKSDEIAEVTQKMNIKMYTLDESFTWDLPGDTSSTNISFKIFDQSSSSASPSYTLTKSDSSVNEGDEITFTITASSAVTIDTQFSWSVEPSDNSGTVDKATSADIDIESGTATISSGATSTTFSVKVLNDSDDENIEGIKVSVLDSNANAIGSETILINNVSNTSGDDEIKGTSSDDDLTLTDGDDLFTITEGRDKIDGGSGIDTLVVSSEDFSNAFITYSNDVKGYRTGIVGQDFVYVKIGNDSGKFTTAINFEKIQTPDGIWDIADFDFSGYNLFGTRDDISDIDLSNNSSKEINLKDILWNYTHPSLASVSYSFTSDNDKLSDQITLIDGILNVTSGTVGEKYTSNITVTAKLVDGKININESNENSSISKTFTVSMTDDDFIEGQTGTSSDDNITLTSGDDTYEYTKGTDKIDGGAGSDTFVANSEDVTIVRAVDVRGEDAYTGVEGKEFLYVIPKSGSGYTIATNFEKIQYDGETSTLDNFNSYSYFDVRSWRNDTEGIKISDQSIENNESKTIDLDKNFFTINKNASLSYSIKFSNDKVSDQILISGSNLSIQGGVGGDKYEVQVTVRATQTFSNGITLNNEEATYEEDAFTITLSDDDYVAVDASSNTTPSQTDSTTITVTEDIPGGVLLDLTSLNIDPGTVELISWAWGSPLTVYSVEGFSENYIYIDEKVLKLKDGAWFDVDRSEFRSIDLSYYNNVTDGQFQITFKYKTDGVSKEHTVTISDFIDTPYGHGLNSDGNFLTYTQDGYELPSTDKLKSLDSGSYWVNTKSNNSEITEIFYSFVPKDSKYIDEAADLDSYYQSTDSRDTIYDPTPEFKSAVYEILEMTSSMFNIEFTELTGSDVDKANIRFVLWDSPATDNAGYATNPAVGASFVFISKNDSSFTKASFSYGVIIHELGHALGIDHPFDSFNFDNISSTYNSTLYSVMAYADIYDTLDYYDTNAYDDTGFPLKSRVTNKLVSYTEWKMLDISVLGLKYGFRSEYNNGDNVYTFEGNDAVTTIHDMGGYDTLDLSSWSNDNDSWPALIDLNGGAVFQVDAFQLRWGDEISTGQVITTSSETKIEKFLGSSGNDKVWLGETSDTILTYSGDDDIWLVGLYRFAETIKVDAGSGDDDVLVYIDNDEVSSLLDIDGGSGYDWLRIWNEEDEIDLTIYMEHFDNFETYWFFSSSVQTIIIDEADFIEVSGGKLGIYAGAEDTVILPEGAVEDTTIVDENYDYYVLNDVTIAIYDEILIG